MRVSSWPAFKTRYLNPYTWLLCSNLKTIGVEVEEFSGKSVLLKRYDIIHLNWPVETIVRNPSWIVAAARMLLLVLILHLAKQRGTKIVWTIHDEAPHVLLHRNLAEIFQSFLYKRTDAFIHLCETSVESAKENKFCTYNKLHFIIPHGHYRDIYPSEMSGIDARNFLGIQDGEITLLYLGYISPYKNVPHLIRCFKCLECSNVRLIIAGSPDNEEIKQSILNESETDPRILTILRYIKDDELQIFFKAADQVVIPFKNILNSGSVLLALSFDKPVLVPDMGAMPEWQQQLGEDWVTLFKDEITAEVLEEVVVKLRDNRYPKRSPIQHLNWNMIARKTLNVYRKVLVPSSDLGH
jgi:beta-1,4-mannosyltransferase